MAGATWKCARNNGLMRPGGDRDATSMGTIHCNIAAAAVSDEASGLGRGRDWVQLGAISFDEFRKVLWGSQPGFARCRKVSIPNSFLATPRLSSIPIAPTGMGWKEAWTEKTQRLCSQPLPL